MVPKVNMMHMLRKMIWYQSSKAKSLGRQRTQLIIKKAHKEPYQPRAKLASYKTQRSKHSRKSQPAAIPKTENRSDRILKPVRPVCSDLVSHALGETGQTGLAIRSHRFCTEFCKEREKSHYLSKRTPNIQIEYHREDTNLKITNSHKSHTKPSKPNSHWKKQSSPSTTDY